MLLDGVVGQIDLAQIALYVFFAFFVTLVFYLRGEDKREGYPLVSDISPDRPGGGVTFPPMASPKTFRLADGHTATVPPGHPDRRDIKARPTAPWPGAPLVPTGNPLQDAVGPASYAPREDKPELTLEGLPLIVPLRVSTAAFVEPRDADPRGMTVIGADRRPAGTVVDLWIDRAEPQIRYLEVEVAGGRRVLAPMTLARVDGKARRVNVKSLLAAQIAEAPGLAHPDRVTKLEEDKIVGYFGGGHLYATPARAQPVL